MMKFFNTSITFFAMLYMYVFECETRKANFINLGQILNTLIVIDFIRYHIESIILVLNIQWANITRVGNQENNDKKVRCQKCHNWHKKWNVNQLIFFLEFLLNIDVSSLITDTNESQVEYNIEHVPKKAKNVLKLMCEILLIVLCIFIVLIGQVLILKRSQVIVFIYWLDEIFSMNWKLSTIC
jgi:hypothetical protein